MLRWIAVALALLASAVVPAALLWWLAIASPLAPALAGLDGVASQFMAVMGVFFALNLVFVCNEIWQSRDAAQLAMTREGEALRNIGRIASNVPAGEGLSILAAARHYAETAIACDFPLRRTDAQADLTGRHGSLPAVIELSNAILDEKVLEGLNAATRSLLTAQLTVVRDRRLERISHLRKRTNKVKWLALLYLGLMSLISIALVHVDDGPALFVSCLVFLGAVNPFIAALFYSRSPFFGLDPLKGAALTAAVDRLRSMERVYRDGGRSFGK